VRWWATAALSWLLAVASKENAATFPAVVWCYEWIFHRSADARWARRSVAWVGAAGVPMVALMFFNYPDPFRDYLFHDFGVVDRLLSLPRVFLYYASLIGLPLPSRLVLMHDFEASSGLFEPPMTALALAALAALVFMALRRLRSEPIIAFAALWFAITLSVESTIFPLRLVHEHRLYLPLAGIAFAVARAGVGLGALAPRLAVVAAGVAIVALATGTHVRNRVWHDGETLGADVVAKSPGAAIGPMNLGVIYAERGERDRATALFQRAIEADPDFGGPYRAIATQKFEAGRTAEAIPLFEKAARLDPLDHYAFGQLGIALYTSGRAEKSLHYFRESLRIKPADRIVNHYGKALFALGRVDEAIAQHRRALMMDPDYAYAHLALGVAEARRGRSREARAAFDRALSIEPLVDAHIELANLDWQQGRARAAVERLRGVIAREPRRFVAANNLAWFLATTADSELSDPEEALGLVAVARGGTVDAGLLDTQAAAQAAAGDYRAALETATAAIALAREAGNTRLVVALEERADSYRAGRRWIDPVTERATDAGP
jgi:tetratricopeptide (TPR) repeat protein